MTRPFPIYRIIHHSNLPHILDIGKVTCPNHAQANPAYRNIGNNDIIRRRNAKVVPFHADRTYLDYVAFYFGPRSIMLYNIKTGHGDVDRVPQDEIIYLVYDIAKIEEHGYDFFFTDGQANIITSRAYDNLADLGRIDLKAANAKDFSASAQLDYPDLKRKKHAEFQIYTEIDFDHIEEIIVLNEDRKNAVEGILKNYSQTKPVRIDPNVYF
jgi:hypothetical protein